MYDEAIGTGIWTDPDHHPLPRWLWHPLKGRVVVSWEPNWFAGAVAISTDDEHFAWHMPTELEVGDLLVTVLDCTRR